MSPYDIQKKKYKVTEAEKWKLIFTGKYQLINVEEMTELGNDQFATNNSQHSYLIMIPLSYLISSISIKSSDNVHIYIFPIVLKLPLIAVYFVLF